MAIAKHNDESPWLLLTFTLPTRRASQRVEVWRKLQRYGSVALGNSGYLLPNNPTNQERFEWLATAIRKYAGEASVVKVQSIDNLSSPQLVGRFAEARAREYQELIRELQKLYPGSPEKRRSGGRLSRLRSRFREIVEIDFFDSPLRKRVEELLAQADRSPAPTKETPNVNPREYVGRVWVTRPCPGIDRSASAWLIRRFIDKRARFIFAPEEQVQECASGLRGGAGNRASRAGCRAHGAANPGTGNQIHDLVQKARVLSFACKGRQHCRRTSLQCVLN